MSNLGDWSLEAEQTEHGYSLSRTEIDGNHTASDWVTPPAIPTDRMTVSALPLLLAAVEQHYPRPSFDVPEDPRWEQHPDSTTSISRTDDESRLLIDRHGQHTEITITTQPDDQIQQLTEQRWYGQRTIQPRGG